MSKTMKAAQISKAGGDFELVEGDIPEPGPGQVRAKVEACGICHNDGRKLAHSSVISGPGPAFKLVSAT